MSDAPVQKRADDAPAAPADSAILRTPSAPPSLSVASLAELAAVRERRNMDIVLVSSRLRLAAKQILALETGNWAELPGRTFIRASLRSYGRLLEVDVEPLLVSIDASLPGSDVLKPSKELRQPMPRQGALGFSGSGPGSRWAWLLLAVVAVVALAFFYGGGPELLNRERAVVADRGAPSASPVAEGAASARRAAVETAAPVVAATPSASGSLNSAGSAVQAAPPPVSAPATPAPSAAASPLAAPAHATAALPILPPASIGDKLTPAPGAAVSGSSPGPTPSRSAPLGAGPPQTPSGLLQSINAPQQSPAAQPAAALPAPAAAAEAPAVPVVRAAPRAPGTGNPLVLRFSGESWIEVRDAAGTVVATGTQQAGMVREFEGEGPFSLIIGNAVAASLVWRGTSVDLAPHMRQGIVRLRVE